MTDHILSLEEQWCLEGCRSYEQYFHMRTAFEKNAGDETKGCVFCHLDRTKNEVLFEDEHVMVWKVPESYMRDELALHALVVPKRHTRFEADLTDEEALSIHHAKQFAKSKFGYMGGLSHVREGMMQLNAGTVPHLHYNIFQPNGTGEVRVPVFKKPEDREKNIARAADFAIRYGKGEVPE